MGVISKMRAISTQFWPPRPNFTEGDIAPGAHTGKVFIVTGGNAGLGYELCSILSKGGATIYMATRSKQRAEAAIRSIEASLPESSPRGTLKFLQLDLSDLNSVRIAAETFAKLESKVDLLWNNAGIGAYAVKHGDRTAQGTEILMGINCVGALLFSELLVPQLKAAAAAGGTPPRVVWMSTVLVDTAAPKNGVDFSTINDGVPARQDNYAIAKAGVWILSREFARRHGPDGIVSVALNPGSLDSGSFNQTPAPLMFVMKLLILQKPIFGAYTMLYSGLSPEITLENNGIFVFPWGRLVPDEDVVRQDILHAMKPEEQGGLGYGRKLWEWCESRWMAAREEGSHI